VAWRNRMELFFMALGFEVWESIVTIETTTYESKSKIKSDGRNLEWPIKFYKKQGGSMLFN